MSSNRKAQEKDEKAHVEMFITVAGLTGTKPAYGDKPDCVLLLPDGRKVALEHREMDREELSAQRAVLERIKEKLKAALAARRLSLHVQLHMPAGSVWFAMTRPPGRRARKKAGLKDEDKIVERVGELAAAHDSAVTLEHAVTLDRPRLEQEGVPGFDLVVFQRYEGKTEPSVQIPAPYFDRTIASIQAAIREKDALLETYTKDAPAEAWLLLVTGMKIAQDALIQVAHQGAFQSKFARVYLLDVADKELLRLVIRPPPPPA